MIKMEFNATHRGTRRSTSADMQVGVLGFISRHVNRTVGQTTAFAASKIQITTAPAARDNDIILRDLFRADTFVKRRRKT